LKRGIGHRAGGMEHGAGNLKYLSPEIYYTYTLPPAPCFEDRHLFIRKAL